MHNDTENNPQKEKTKIPLRRPPLYFAIFCFIMALIVAYYLGQRGLLSVVIFMVMGVFAVMKAMDKDRKK